jgi:hypothetical protein
MGFAKVASALLSSVLSFALHSAPVSAQVNEASSASRTNVAQIAARKRFFGAENVDLSTGKVRADRVIFSWVTNATLAVSIEGRIILLDTYINRLEVAPPPDKPDLRRSPINVQDLVDLHPEAIFLGHGHGDHADNAAYISKWLDIPIYATAETCDVMQVDLERMYRDADVANNGVKLVPDSKKVKCVPVISRGSQPGAETSILDQLAPIAKVVVFKHIHSGPVPTDPNFPFVPVINSSDPRETQIYPPGKCFTPTIAKNLEGCSGNGVPVEPTAGQENLTTTGFGTIPGSPGGPISLFYQFVLCDDAHFTFEWHDTTGPLKEGVGSDPGLPSAQIGAHLFDMMEKLTPTDIEFGSIVSAGYSTNGVRDPVMYQQHIKPLIYVPLHMTNVAAISSSLEFKKTYFETLDAMKATYRPEVRWLVDPNDYLRAMSYDPNSARWNNPRKAATADKLCK